MIRNFIILLGAVAFTSCSNESTSDLVGDQNIENVTYNDNVRTIINNNCIICHGTIPANGAPMSLVTYQNVVDAVNNRGLLDRIQRHEGEPGLMPLGGPRLPQNVIDIIVQWHAQGLQE